MAKQPTLTINVQSQQFQNFAKDFSALAKQMTTLNASFQQINASLNKSNILVRGMQASMNGLLYLGKAVGAEFYKITKHLISWGTIVGGITALLGMGGGLFGIERLAASIMAKRRTALGLGQDYGKTQASAIFNQSLTGNALDIQRNIRLGMAGSTDQMTALQGMGINTFDPEMQKLDPDQIMDLVVKRLPAIMNQAGPALRMQMYESFKVGSLGIDPMTAMRYSTAEGQKEYEEIKKMKAEYAPKMKISERAQKAWTLLEIQMQAAGAQIHKIFGEKLADLAGPLKNLSEGFTHLVDILMKSPAVKAVIEHLARWIDALAEKMKELGEKDIEEFIEEIKKLLPDLETFKTDMKDFVAILHGAVTLLGWLKYWNQTPAEVWSDVQKRAGVGGPDSKGTPGTVTVTPAGKSIFNSIQNALTSPLIGNRSQTTAPASPVPASPASPAPAAPSFGAGATPFNRFGGLGGGLSQLPMDAAKSALGNALRLKFPGTQPPAATGESWSGAAKSMLPQRRGGVFGTMPSPMQSEQRGPGPLSMNNWQMNRTASLVVRNVPGSNIFMTAAGMTG
jgi:hypothetical protein